MKKLIVVESPSKAKTIKNFLDSSYEVVASKGHIRDLPKTKMGVKYNGGNFEIDYVVDKDHSEIVKDLKKIAKDTNNIYIATDEDREGEAIGYHIAVALGKDPTNLPRIVFHEVTKKAIHEALENPRFIDMNMVNAQQARRVMDRIVGYNLSPLLASKIQKGLSAGRVQSSSLKILVDREKEILAFIPQEYWKIDAIFQNDIAAEIYSYKSQKLEKLSIKSETEANEIYKNLIDAQYVISKIEKKERKTSPQPPFMTSTLQQSASTVLGFSPKKTMMVAQNLYEGVKTPNGVMGVITYMRTDSLYITPDANSSAREYIEKTFGLKYLSENVRFYKSKSKGAQEAHEAIRPTDINFTTQLAEKYLKNDEYRLYKLIYDRFIATQMSEMISENQNIFITCENGEFKASGRRIIFDGYNKLLNSSDKDKILPSAKEGESLILNKLNKEQNFTEPPSRYSEAGLVKILESLGIGRPSTYAPTISTLQTRGYIDVEKKQIIPTKIAFTVTDLLEKYFNEIVDSNFTASMEEELDDVSENKKDWQKILADFYEPFIDKVKSGKKDIPTQKIVEPIGEECPECQNELVKRKGRFGEFISCSTYPKCKYTRNIENENSVTVEDEKCDLKCDKCGADMVIKSGKRGKFYACSSYPVCKNTMPLNPPKVIETPCPKCNGKILERISKRGKFYGCENYPKCDFISKHPITNKKCPECKSVMAERILRKKDIYECINSECKHKEEKK